MRNIKALQLTQHLYILNTDFTKPLYIVGFGDVHYGAGDHAEHDFNKFCEYYKTFIKRHQCYFLGLGDYIEFFSSRERTALSSPDIHETTIDRFDKEGEALTDELYEKIKFMQGHLLGLIEGNHHWEFSYGTTSANRLCDKLGCPYLAAGLYGKLKLYYQDKNEKARHTIDIYAAHSSGGTITISGSLMKMERFAGAVKANIYFLGHDHQHITADVPLMELSYAKDGDGVRIVEYRRCVARTGSFKRAFQGGIPSYAIDRLYRPTGIGNAEVEICFTENHEGERYFILNPSLRSW